MSEINVRITTTPPATIEVLQEGPAGPVGPIGPEGPEGPEGPIGPQGVPGAGLATGGTVGQIIAKTSATDFETEWRTPPAGLTPQDFGAVGDGIADDTAALTAWLVSGGNIYAPEGIYRVAGTGPDSGGVLAEITKSISVVCHPNAKFVGDDLDNDIIRIVLPADGTGLPAEGITVEWKGGYFDQSAQKVSTVVPFAAEYPPPSGLAGTSLTCDALSIRGDYTTGGIEYSGIKRAVVSQVTTYAGDHWQIAGGDGAIFVGGCEEQIIRDCTNIGARDLGIYASGGDDALLRCRTLIENNLFVNCFHGASIKRSAEYGRISGNHAINCVRGYLIDTVAGTGFKGVEVSGNTGEQCGTFIRIRDTVGFSACENHFTSIGALLADGTTVEPLAGSVGILAGLGCNRGIVSGNTLDGRTAGLATAYPTHEGFLKTESTGTRVSFRSNIGNDLRVMGVDNGTSNIFMDNVLYNAITTAYMSVLGTGSFEQRRDPATNSPVFRQQVGFGDGTVALPAIARGADPTTGIYFTTNEVRLAGGGVNNFRMSDTAVGFFGNLASGNAWTAATGTPNRATFDTATVTTAQLAQRVKSIIDDLKLYGLFR